MEDSYKAGKAAGQLGGDRPLAAAATADRGRASPESEALEHLLDLSLDLLAVAGFDGYFKRLSRSWERVLGYSPEELLSTPYIELVHPDDRAKTRTAVLQLAGPTSDTIEFGNRCRHKDGSYRRLRWSARSDPRQGLVYAAAEDITERTGIEPCQRLLFERNPHPMWVYDVDTLAFLAVNDAAVHHYGYSREEFLAMTIKDIRPREDLSKLADHLARAGSGYEPHGPGLPGVRSRSGIGFLVL
jgi:PAS domain S-box-containing protein